MLLTAQVAEAKTWAIPKPDASVDALQHPGEYANRVMDRINDIRAKKGKSRVKSYQGCLDRKSDKWAKHLAALGALVHRDQTAVLKDCNLHWTGETLVSGTSLEPRAAVKAWMHSAPHRAVIMKDRANRAGVGAVVISGFVVCVLNFGDPT
jgi:uncharacterized protein YkwD